MSELKKGSPSRRESQTESLVGQCPENKMKDLIIGLGRLAQQQQQEAQPSKSKPDSDSTSKDTSENQ